MSGSISYFNAELGTQSLLKINTKENPKVAKPILIPFLFLVPGSFVFPLQLGSCILHGPTLNIVRVPTYVLWMPSLILTFGWNRVRGNRGKKGKKIQQPFL